jgi:hypothetical protein
MDGGTGSAGSAQVVDRLADVHMILCIRFTVSDHRFTRYQQHKQAAEHQGRACACAIHSALGAFRLTYLHLAPGIQR